MEARVTAAVTELKARQAKEREERMARVRAKQEAEEAAENAEQETDVDATTAVAENGTSDRHFRNRVLPFEPLPQINEEGNNSSPSLYRDASLSTPSAKMNGVRRHSRTTSVGSDSPQVPHLPPISSSQMQQRRLPPINNNFTATPTPVYARSMDQLSHTSSMDRHSSDDSTTQRSDTRRKRKKKRFGRLQEVSPSTSQDNSPTNSQSSEVVHVRPARPSQHTVVRQHAAIPEDDEILEEMPSVQYGRTDETRILSPIDERKQSLESNDQNERRQSIRSQDMSDAPSTIHSVKQDQDIHSRHVHFKSPQASARSRVLTRRTSTDSNHSKENGVQPDQFPTLTQRERFFEEINERR